MPLRIVPLSVEEHDRNEGSPPDIVPLTGEEHAVVYVEQICC